MPEINFRIIESYELGPYIDDLRALEASMTYPLDDDAFTIDHGKEYHPFFSQMGAARFLVVEVDGVALGTLAGVWREVEIGGVRTQAVYLGDFKLDPSLRGGKTARALALHALSQWWRRPELGGWRFVFGAAMRGAKGDVMRTTRSDGEGKRGGYHAGTLLEPLGSQVLYFVSPSELAKVSSKGEPLWPTEYADLTPDADLISGALERTAGRKDFQLTSTGRPWPLVHLPVAPQRCPLGYGAYLRRCAKLLIEQDLLTGERSIACFGIDARATHAIGWLARAGLEPGARCGFYGIHFPKSKAHPDIREVPYIHLSTAMI